MSDQTNQPAQTPEELRKNLLNQLEESKKALGELSDEDLEVISGGIGFGSLFSRAGEAAKGGRRGPMITGAIVGASLMPIIASSSSSTSQQ